MKKTDPHASEEAFSSEDGQNLLVRVDDYAFPRGWSSPREGAVRSRQCCELLEEGRVLYFERLPYVLFQDDKEFLLSQRQSGSRLHKNVSYRPAQDVLRGAAGMPQETKHLHDIMRKYSEEVTRFVKQLLSPYAGELALDFASYRPEEEEGRDLSVHKRNDLLHLDAFPTRPMNGHRILRCFTNINPAAPRVWHTTGSFSALAEKYAADAGLAGFAAKRGARSRPLLRRLKQALGLKAMDHSA